MNIDLNLTTVFTGAMTLVVSVIGWMLKGIAGEFKEAMKRIGDHEVRLALLEQKVESAEDRYLRHGGPKP